MLQTYMKNLNFQIKQPNKVENYDYFCTLKN